MPRPIRLPAAETYVAVNPASRLRPGRMRKELQHRVCWGVARDAARGPEAALAARPGRQEWTGDVQHPLNPLMGRGGWGTFTSTTQLVAAPVMRRPLTVCTWDGGGWEVI